MEFEITEILDFDVDYLAHRIACMEESLSEALYNGSLEGDYHRLNEQQRKNLKIAIFKSCLTELEKKD